MDARRAEMLRSIENAGKWGRFLAGILHFLI